MNHCVQKMGKTFKKRILFLMSVRNDRQSACFICAISLLSALLVKSYAVALFLNHNSEESTFITKDLQEKAIQERLMGIKIQKSRASTEISRFPFANMSRSLKLQLNEDPGQYSTDTTSIPILWSFAGSEYKWVQSLIESSSGVMTGSLYNQSSLKKFQTEGSCKIGKSCISMDPRIYSFDIINAYNYIIKESLSNKSGKDMSFFQKSFSTEEMMRLKQIITDCYLLPQNGPAKGRRALLFRKAVIIDRDPIWACFSELERIFSGQIRIKMNLKSGPHTVGKSEKNSNPDGRSVLREMAEKYLQLGNSYIESWETYNNFYRKNGPKSLKIIRYEDLKDIKKREVTLMEILQFLGLPAEISRVQSSFNSDISEEKRRKMNTNFESHTGGLDRFLQLKFRNSTIGCHLWKEIKNVASERGYKEWNKLCNIKSKCFERKADKDKSSFPSRMRSLKFSKNKKGSISSSSIFDRFINEKLSAVKKEQRSGTKSHSSFDLLSKANKVANRMDIIVAFSLDIKPDYEQGYTKHLFRLLNWLQWIKNSNISNVIVAVADKYSKTVVDSLGYESVIVKIRLKKKWKVQNCIYTSRLKVIKRLVKAGFNVLHSDLDAIWLRNPFQILHQTTSNYSIVASKGTFPFHLSKKWKASTLCMGLIYFKSDKCSIKILNDSIFYAIRSSGDDQIGINEAIDRNQVKWTKKNIGKFPKVDRNPCSTSLIRLIAEKHIVRNCKYLSEDVYIAHCFIRGTSGLSNSEYAKKMRNLGLWFPSKHQFDSPKLK